MTPTYECNDKLNIQKIFILIRVSIGGNLKKGPNWNAHPVGGTMSKVDEIMDTINEQLDAINELNSFIKFGICIFLTVIAFQIVKMELLGHGAEL